MEEHEYGKMLPGLLSGDNLIDELQIMPEYDDSVRNLSTAERLVKLSELYKVYIPSAMSVEIYNKLYLAALLSLNKKETKLSVIQQNSNYAYMQGNEYRGIIGGADSFTIIGKSGIGKSSAIERAVHLISGGRIIENQKPYAKIIPCLTVQCPFDCSSKGMLLEILRVVDMTIDTKYYERSQRAGVTTDVLIGTVAQVAINHIGLLIIDEIQHVAGHKSGRMLMGMLTQLINTSGISICMVGTPECIPFFEKAMQLARRSVGLRYTEHPCDDYFRNFCSIAYGYQYVRNKSEISEIVIDWLYEHSVGIISVVVSLIHDAQELSIFSGREVLDMDSLNEAYLKRLSLLHGYTGTSKKTEKHTGLNKRVVLPGIKKKDVSDECLSISDMVRHSKDLGEDIVAVMKKHITVTEIKV